MQHTALDRPPAGSRLAELSRADRSRVAAAVADLGPGIWQSPLCGGSIDNVGRYVAEARLADHMRDRYSFAVLWGAAAECARACPDVLSRPPHEVRAATVERGARACAHERAAVAAFNAGDYITARAELDLGEIVEPDFRNARLRTWGEMREIVARREGQS